LARAYVKAVKASAVELACSFAATSRGCRSRPAELPAGSETLASKPTPTFRVIPIILAIPPASGKGDNPKVCSF
jgi:hypothetical protein